MIVNIYTFRDIQVPVFQKPFYDTNEPLKVQVMTGRRISISSAEEVEKNHLADLELYYLGTYDDETGVIVSKPQFLLRCSDYIRKGGKADEQSVQVGSEATSSEGC